MSAPRHIREITFPVLCDSFPVTIRLRRPTISIKLLRCIGLRSMDCRRRPNIPCNFPVKQGIWQRTVRSQLRPPPASLAFSLSRCRCGRKLHFAAQNARISRGQTSNVCLKRTAGLAMCLYFSEAGSGSGDSQAKLNHRFALTALRQPVFCLLSLG
jgi:hypothetical protein